MTKRILLLDCNPCLLIKLVRPQKAKNRVFMVCQDHVSRGIQLDKNMVGILAFTERNINHPVNAQLLDALALFRP